MKGRSRDNKWLIIYIALNLIVSCYGLLSAQQVNDWDATSILNDMEKSWSVGNGCFEGNRKVVNSYGIELNGNTLEVMDARIQVFGRLTNWGEDISLDNSLIIYSCSSSEIVVYDEILNVEDVVEDFSVRVYPNPTNHYLNIDVSNLDSYTIYDINGKLVGNGVNKRINAYNLSEGIYFLVLRYMDMSKTFRFIKK